jgi:hypothetical protein
MNFSREHTIEALNRGDLLEIDLDEFASLDNGKCGCIGCLAFRRALADGSEGTIYLMLASRERERSA